MSEPSVEPLLIAGGFRQSPAGTPTFCAVNPQTREPLAPRFPVSDSATVREMLQAAAQAAPVLRECSVESVAKCLELCADYLEARAEPLVHWANLETALPREPRLSKVELPRTASQLRAAAQATRERTFCQPVIDTQNNLRTFHAPLGAPVVCFGPNNFPFAFNAVLGGDFASALAAQCPVIAKAHPAHPKTSQLLAEVAFDAIVAAGLPPQTLQLVYDLPRQVGLEMVEAPEVGAVAFTGSRRAGLALKAAADAAGKPIYLEMSSINPVFYLPGALRERGAELAVELFGSCTLGVGQFCTNPGISVVLDRPETEAWLGELVRKFREAAPGVLLSVDAPEQLQQSLSVLTAHGAERLVGGGVTPSGNGLENTLLKVDAARFLEAPTALQTEAFGPVHLVVVARDEAQLVGIAAALEGNLTGCVYSARDGSDDEAYQRIAAVLRYKVGRLLNDKMPTGVAVSPAMNHGGPYPATGHPGFTGVGMPAAIRRFTALHCYDNVRPERLPAELQDGNPLGVWRQVDGRWTREPFAVA